MAMLTPRVRMFMFTLCVPLELGGRNRRREAKSGVNIDMLTPCSPGVCIHPLDPKGQGDAHPYPLAADISTTGGRR